MDSVHDTLEFDKTNIASGGYSDKGIREKNEDSFLIIKDITNPTFMAADGAGGYYFGKEASRLTVNAFKDEISRVDDTDFPYIGKLMETKYDQVNKYLYSRCQETGKRMMTTLSMVNVIGNKVMISNIGDTVVYRISEGKITLVSKPHSLAWEQYESGLINYEEYLNHPRKNVITRALGAEGKAKPYFNAIEKKNNDIYIICTDGVYYHVHPESLLKYFEGKVHNDKSLDYICKEVGKDVLRRNGDDNLTIVALQILG